MNGETRRKEILKRLHDASAPVSASHLAAELGVSRQVIVQDIALLRATGSVISALSRGYVLENSGKCQRVFKVCHSDEDVETEMNLIVDAGGTIEDVFVYHKAYGTVRAPMNIKSRLHVQKFIAETTCGKSSLLKNITSGYHYHTVSADSEETLDHIEQCLRDSGFWAQLTDYEPIDFTQKQA